MIQNPRRPKIFMMDLLATVPYYTAYLSKALLKEDIDLTVGSITYYLDPVCYSSRGIKNDPGLLDVIGKLKLARLPRRILKLCEGLLNLSALGIRFLAAAPDVVHVQYLPMLTWRLPLDFWFLKFCRMRGSKIVLTVHDLLPHDTADAHKRTFQHLYDFVDGIICHSDHIEARLQSEFNVPSAKISVIPHGPFFYDLPDIGSESILRSFGIDHGKIMVLWQGIIFPYKGVDLLLDAWQKIEIEYKNACLVIAGTGSPDLLKQIREQAELLNLERVHLHFRFITTEELVALYRAATIVIYPYRAITTSGALATGLALGKAIVASDLPVFRELLTDRKNALLVDPHLPDKLAAALIELIQNENLRKRLTEEVQEMNFGDRSWATIAEKTVSIYKQFSLVGSNIKT
jgi:glycosyltransferase involved in cell wall biosynthesis